ncbi:MAG: hypothetical protein KBB11_10575 [Bacteroidales bacterium]|nr:hypothetical protein [Bacteroidales bacterium]HOY39271.1 hypothetical protein [Bacteroidales bacterium]HQP04051.1 hypothetical protein [Bacteroidales bacterium]
MTFDHDGTCSLCSKQKTFQPIGENKLLELLENAKAKKAPYDVLVPLSGGKDSTYILHLAVNVYKLRVLTMTFDNGLFSDIARANINLALQATGVDHVWCRPDEKLLNKIYGYMLLNTGDICGTCDIATKANIIKVACDYRIPYVLYGTSPLEEDSFVPDSIQDVARFKYIIRKSKEFSNSEINKFLIYPNLNNFVLSVRKSTGAFAREIRPLFYLNPVTDREIGCIISQTMGWRDDSREYSKHLDCIAEPLTNYIRNRIYGYERRLCQFSNMVRNGEISREHALQLYQEDCIETIPQNAAEVLAQFGLRTYDIEKIVSYKPLQYEKNTSGWNSLYARIMKIRKK